MFTTLWTSQSTASVCKAESTTTTLLLTMTVIMMGLWAVAASVVSLRVRYKDHGGEVWDDYDDDEYFDGESGAARRGLLQLMLRHMAHTTPAKRTGAAKRKADKPTSKKKVSSLFTGGGKSRLGASVLKMSEVRRHGAFSMV